MISEDTVMEKSIFVYRWWKYGSVGVKIAAKGEAVSHAAKILRSKLVNLLPMYKKKNGIGKVAPRIKCEWVGVVILSTTDYCAEIVSVSKTCYLNW